MEEEAAAVTDTLLLLDLLLPSKNTAVILEATLEVRDILLRHTLLLPALMHTAIVSHKASTTMLSTLEPAHLPRLRPNSSVTELPKAILSNIPTVPVVARLF